MRLGVSGANVRGLSLLEVIVTVAIFSMLFSVLMTGWQQSMKAQSQLDGAAKRIQAHQQLSMMLRQVIGETVNPKFGAGVKFQGSASSIQAETSASLMPAAGAAPLSVELSFRDADGKRRLEVAQAGGKPLAYAWRFELAKLKFLDNKGLSHDQWPPLVTGGRLPSPLESANHLPSLVVLTYRLVDEQSTRTLLVAPRNAFWEFPEPSSPLVGMGMQ